MTCLKIQRLVCVCVLSAILNACAGPAAAVEKTTGATRRKAVRDLAARIDERIDAHLQAEGIEPSPAADDAEYFRRVWLHLAGTIPPVSEVRRFLADAAADKRERAVEDLLSRPSFVRNFTTFWRRAWLPEADTDPIVQAQVPALEAWLRRELLDNCRYDELVQQLIAAPVASKSTNIPARMNEPGNGSVAFLMAKEAKPENLAAGVSRAFLGVRLDCAQCHDHPFDRWKRDQFWSLAAFFAGLERGDENQPAQNNLLQEVADRRELMIPETERLVSAVFLDGGEPKWRTRGGRQLLAEWVTSPRNPFFAKAAVNRLWGHLFGVGLVDPVDDFSTANVPSHPELLDDLAQTFLAREFDVKFILQAVTGTRAYQRTSRHASADVPVSVFAHLPVQGLSSEQLVRSLSQITAMETLGIDRLQPLLVPADELSTLFTRPGESPTQRQTTILQALTLMNGRTTASALDVEQGPLLAAVLDFPASSTTERIETLFLATLSRFPTDAEAARLTTHIEAAADSATAFGDILWALLNSAEFGCNH